MILSSLSLAGFRNLWDQSIDFSSGINVIRGENAQGKTNLLEAIFMLSCGRGFRTRFDRELIRFGNDFSKLEGEIFSHGRQQTIDIKMGRCVRKQISLNGVRKNSSELSEAFRVVLFCPDDLNMIKEGAKERRRFIDMAISQLKPSYAELMSEYTRLYEHKRRILCDWREKPSLLDALEEYSDFMCRCSAKIIRYRAAYIKKLSMEAGSIHSRFSGNGEELSVNYNTVSTVTDPFAPAVEIYQRLKEHQKSHREAEIASCSVLTGIHKDDLEISINGITARNYASQGQMRTAALSLKMAEREVSFQDTGENPVLLLDDVLSELDPRRQEFVLNRIGEGQTFITCCEDSRIKERTGGQVINVSEGKVSLG
ncbi:MAG: DNA replication/repair protein RecF [Clostridiales bacterium]|nr:DNA replication/repair protein RecF [Clostridiales bacterium]